MTNGEKEILNHMRCGWKAVINKRTFYVIFVKGNKIWTPKGATGATVNRLMQKGILDFEKKAGTFCGLVRVKERP